MSKLSLDHVLHLRVDPPRDGRCRVTVTVGSEQVIAAELERDVLHPTVCEWLRIAMEPRK